MAGLRVSSVVRGYHVYETVWKPSIGDEFETTVEEGNSHDRYAVAVIVSGMVVGHVPREMSKDVFYFIKHHGGTVKGLVTGKRQLSTVWMKGMEIPCIYEFYSGSKKLKTLRKLLKNKDFEII